MQRKKKKKKSDLCILSPAHATRGIARAVGTLLFALPTSEEVTRILTNNPQTYNTTAMTTDNAIYFALMSLRQW